MSRIRAKTEQRGFTLIELLTALGIFLLVCGAAFTLLGTSQQRYQTDAQVLNSFQEARLGLDQIVRDVNDSGYPPPSFNDGNHTHFTDSPFAWSTGYPTNANPTGTPCTIGVTCVTPADFDLIIETKINPQDAVVSWVRYQLQGTTLVRGTIAGDDARARHCTEDVERGPGSLHHRQWTICTLRSKCCKQCAHSRDDSRLPGHVSQWKPRADFHVHL